MTYIPESAIATALRLAHDLGRPPTQRETRSAGVSARLRHSDVLKAAGLDVRPRGPIINRWPEPPSVLQDVRDYLRIEARARVPYQAPPKADETINPLQTWMV